MIFVLIPKKRDIPPVEGAKAAAEPARAARAASFIMVLVGLDGD